MKLRPYSVLFLLFAGCATLPSGAAGLDVQTTLSRTTAYPNQQVIMAYNLYTRLDTRYEGFKHEPELPFQWFEDRPVTNSNVVRTTVTHNGARYVMAEIRHMSLFPMKAGAFTLKPGVIDASYRTHGAWGGGTSVKQLLAFPPVTLQVLPFPEAGKPDDFNGLTGELKFSMEEGEIVQRDGGEYIQLRIGLSGYAYARRAPLPRFDLPEGLVIEKTEDETIVQWMGSEASSVKNFKVLIRPEKAGTYKIPAPHFSYFSPAVQTYTRVSGKKEHEFTVLNAPAPKAAPAETPAAQVHVLLDVSGSMKALDFKPQDRMSVARSSLHTLLSDPRMDGNHTALTVFAKHVTEIWSMEAHSPKHLALLETVRMAEKDLDGTATGSAIYEALKGFAPGEGKKYILLLTDGARNAGYVDHVTAASMAAENSVVIYTIAIGKGGVVTFPIPDNDFGNREVQTEVKVDTDAIRKISAITNGKYFEINTAPDFKAAVEELTGVFTASSRQP